eukprot:15438144-Alexandrium_andersonii.AAC.1
MTHKVSGRTSVRGATYRLIRSSSLRMSKWTAQYCLNDPMRSNDAAIEQPFLEEDILDRAKRGEVPGGGPGRKMIRPN